MKTCLIFDDRTRPETTGGYCHRALTELSIAKHVLPDDAAAVQADAFKLFLAIDDGLDYELPGHLHPLAYWAIDTHLDFDRSLRRSQQADFVFAAQRDGAERLRQAGIPTATWLPLACDPEIHRPYDVLKEYDISFVGNLFPGPRSELLRLVQERHPRTFIGQRYFNEMAQTYSQSKLVFNRSIRIDVNMRVFEALACGSMLITNDLADNGQSELFQDGVHLATYRDADELLDKIGFYLKHDDVRERIAARGRAEVVANHTYRHRMQTILETVERAQSRTTVAAPTPLPVRKPPMCTPAPKDRSYFDWPRPEVLALVPPDARRVLDIGCASGRLGASIKARQTAEVVGVELDPDAAAAASSRLDRVLCANIEQDELDLPEAGFDCVICADVLEHLRTPELVLARIRGWLQPGGTLVVSLPNARHHSVVCGLLAGNWTYESAGLLDSDHVRFFTRREIEKLLFRAGFEIRTLPDSPRYTSRNSTTSSAQRGRL